MVTFPYLMVTSLEGMTSFNSQTSLFSNSVGLPQNDLCKIATLHFFNLVYFGVEYPFLGQRRPAEPSQFGMNKAGPKRSASRQRPRKRT